MSWRRSLVALSILALAPLSAAQDARRIKVLFLGDRGHHQPARRAAQALAPLASRAIDLYYSERLTDLQAATLRRYDCVLVYANLTALRPAQEQALLDFVASGKGLVAVHCASYCFLNSEKYVELVGAQFQRHGTGVFRDTIVDRDHAITRGLDEIESWDETYVHHKHNPDRIVLAERVEGEHREPWTWVRDHGDGRVFYTAWGHDHRTWSNLGFHELLARGIRWASGGIAQPASPFQYAKANLPHYQPGGSRADPGRVGEMQEPLSSERSMERMVVPPGFRIELFASEPDIVNPIAFTWDARGRLWVAETVDYPNSLKRDGGGQDRIKILEDTDGDGRADRSTIFADGLSIPTGLVCSHDGVIVAQAPDMLYLADTDGDDRADQRHVLFTGFATNDTHAGPSNLRYGHDNRVWATVGYAGFDGTVGGTRHRFRQGIFCFEDDGSDLEFIASTSNNTWGLGLSEEGFVFGSTANGNPSVSLAIPNRFYENVSGWSTGALEMISEGFGFHPITDRVRQVDYHGGFTAAAGHALYTARSLPERYWNRVAFVAAPTGHLLHQFILERNGTEFVARNGWNLLASDDEWVAPVMAEVGPDGAVWVSDWYNFVVQHNPTPRGFSTGRGNAYVTPVRDKQHGRIYRIVHEDAPPAADLDLSGATPEQLVAALRNDNMFWRLTAQRLLVERSRDDMHDALIELVDDRTRQARDLNVGAIHALWTLHGLGLLRDDAADRAARALTHPSAAVRRTALMVLPHTESLLSGIRRVLTGDEDAHVRLAALLALAEVQPDPAMGRLVFDALAHNDRPDDRWIPEAMIAAAARHDAGFLAAVLTHRRVAEPHQPSNRIENGSAESIANGQPVAWTMRRYSGTAEHTTAAHGHGGRQSLRISSTEGSDTSWFATVEVEPDTQYRLSGWIRTEGVEPRGSAEGALFNVHELQGGSGRVQTQPVTGTSDWTRAEVTFDSGRQTRLTINCLFGGWGQAVGTAWYDDVELVPLRPSPLPGNLGQAMRVVTRHYASRAPADSIAFVLGKLPDASDGIAAAFLEGLAAGWPKGRAPELSPDQRRQLAELLPVLPTEARDRLLALAERWGTRDLFAGADVGTVTADLRALVADADRSDQERGHAARRLFQLEDSTSNTGYLLDQITPRITPELAGHFLDSLTASARPETGRGILDRWPTLTPTSRARAISTVLRRPAWTRDLLERIERGAFSRADLNAEHWLQLTAHADPAVRRLAIRVHEQHGQTTRGDVVDEFLAAATTEGDAARGEVLFNAHCALCHVRDDAGGKIGPPLTGIGARARADILVDILDPNRSVEANYELWTATTRDGQIFAGRLLSETRTAVELLDLAGSQHILMREDLATMRSQKLSLMPASFEHLGVEGLADLLEYLVK